MAKFGRKGNFTGLSIINPFNVQLPGKIPDEELSVMVEWLRYGVLSPIDIEELYMSHVRLGIRIASEYGIRAPHLAPDLVSVSMLGIAEAIHNAPDRLIDNCITPYIQTTIRGKILDYIGDQHIVPSRTYRYKIAKNNGYVAPRYETLVEGQEKIARNQFEVAELMEEIERCVVSDTNLKRREYKRAVISLKAAGFKYREISEILEVSETYVRQLIQSVKEMYDSSKRAER